MAPRKRKSVAQEKPSDAACQPEPDNPKKRTTKVQKEQVICKKKLATLEEAESYSTDDRFTAAEKECLLDAYSKFGFRAFQDMHLLKSYLPNRRENDLRGLLDRLKMGLQRESGADTDKADTLNDWQKLCQEMMNKLARDAKSSMDNALADALTIFAEDRERMDKGNAAKDHDQINYPELLRSFAQLLMGKFPDNMTPANARASMKLFDHINSLVDGINCSTVAESIESGSWLETSKEERKQRQEMALAGLKELDDMAKKCPSERDLEKSKNIEALCLELPKIKRITELLNPLGINESLVNGLID